jgi:hypothetical protein
VEQATTQRGLRALGFAGAACALFGLALSLATPGPVRAADAPGGLDKFAGDYKYNGTKDQGMEIVEKAFDEALSDLNLVLRVMAKKAMAQRFAERIVIDVARDKVGIKIGENEKVSVGLGKTETVKSSDGKGSGKATHKFEGGKLIESLVGDTGTITNVFTLSGDGKTLTRDVTVSGERLKKPAKYRLVYVRK